MFINRDRTDLVAGFRQAKKARTYLLGKWRFRLLSAYRRKWDAYAQELARSEIRKIHYRKRMLPGIVVGLVLLYALGMWRTLTNSCLGPPLIMVAIIGGFMAWASWLVYPPKPQLPEHPLEQHSKKNVSPLKKRLFPDILPRWWQGLEAYLPSAEEVQAKAEKLARAGDEKWGIIGEFNLVRGLDAIVSTDTLILHSLNPKPRDDLDVVVIGPKGLWYFEVKHWNAEFEWCDGIWRVLQYDHESGTKYEKGMNEYPDAQRKRMCALVLENLNARGQELIKQAPVVTDIKGGIVFSNKNAELNIEGPTPFRWGRTEDWISIYEEAPVLKGMTPEVILRLTEILLRRHQELNPNMELSSMKDHLLKVLDKVERGIQEWIDV